MRKLYGSTNWRRVLAFVLVFAMLFSALGSSGYSVFAESQDETGEAVVAAEPEAVTPEVTEDIQGPSPGEESEEAAEIPELVEGIEAEAEEGEEPEEAVEAEAVEGEDSEEAEEAAEPVEEAEEGEEPAEDPAEEAEEGEEPAEEPAMIAEILNGLEEGQAAEAEEPAEEKPEIAYPAMGFRDIIGGISVTVGAPEGAFPYGTEMKLAEVEIESIIDAVADAVEGNIVKIKAVDITFFYEGKEIQPLLPINVKMNASGMTADSERQVVHIDDEGEATVIEDADTSKKAVEFEADSFSVYVLVETEYPRLTINFMNGGESPVVMYVKGGEHRDTDSEIDTIVYDPGVVGLQDTETYSEVFRGWVADTEKYSSDSTFLTINDIRTTAKEKAASITSDETITYYAGIFKQYTVTYTAIKEYVLEGTATPVVVGTKTEEIPRSETEAVHTVGMAYTVDDSHNFMGWIVEEGDNYIDGYPENASTFEDNGETIYFYPNDDEITITGPVTFKPYAPEGHWLVFDENGKGGKYNASQFVLIDQVTKRPIADEEMTRYGYDFEGWYLWDDVKAAYHLENDEDLEAKRDPKTKHIAIPENLTKYTFGQELTKKTTVLANWTPQKTGKYTVICWTQSEDSIGKQTKKYDLKEAFVEDEALIGSNIPYTFVDNGAEDYVQMTIKGVPQEAHYTGFCLTEGSKNQTVTITPEGDAVLNLYFDRIEYNLRFYIYRQQGTGANAYSYAENSRAGGNVWSIATWYGNTSLSNMPTADYPILSENSTFDGYTGYYFVIKAAYGEDISSKWPTYDKIHGPANNRQPVSFIMMDGAGMKPAGGTGSGRDTVKGLITVMDERILGATNNADGNFLIVRFNTYNNWTYHIYYETLDGVEYDPADIREVNGTKYYLDHDVQSRSSNTDAAQQNPPQYPGFVTVKDSSGDDYYDGSTSTGGYQLNYYYNRQMFTVSYFDGSYLDGNHNLIQNRSLSPLSESKKIGQGAVIPEDVINYVPDLPAGEEGYVFEGWYADAACNNEASFGTMPIGGITVYAKWRQIEYRVFLRPNFPGGVTDELKALVGDTNIWGSATQELNFRIPYGGKVSTPRGVIKGYDFYGWFLDEDGSDVFTDTTSFREDDFLLPYDNEAAINYTDKMDQFGEGATYNKDKDNNRTWITKKAEIYGSWGKVLVGAAGITVIYDVTEDGVAGSVPEDTANYLDNTFALAGIAATAADPDKKVFDHWVLQTWDGEAFVDKDDVAPILPGENFKVYIDDSKITDASGNVVAFENVETNKKYTYEVQLKAVYKAVEEKTPTHIYWYKNNGDSKPLYIDNTDGTLTINAGVAIHEAPTWAGYKFLGWAKVTPPEEITESYYKQALTEDDLFLVYNEGEEGEDPYYTATIKNNGEDTVITAIYVAADEKQPYNDLFAVWDAEDVNYTVEFYYQNLDGTYTKDDALTATRQAATDSPVAVEEADLAQTKDGSYEFSEGNEKNVLEDTVNADGSTVLKVYYDLGKADVIVEHYLVGQEEPFKTDTIEDQIIGSTYTATPEEVYPETELALYLEEEGDFSITVSADEEENYIYIYYKLLLTIEGEDGEKTYDGEPLTGKYTISGFLESDEEYIQWLSEELSEEAPSITNVGEGPLDYPTEENQPEILEIQEYYIVEFEYESGTLTILPRPITLTSADDSKDYDGTPLTNSNVTVGGEGFVEGEGATYNVTGTITDPGSVSNAFTYTLNDGTLADNYTITQEPGTLTVTRVTKEIVITAESDSKIYDGTELTKAAYTYTEGILAEGDELTAVVEGTITNVGTAANVVTSYKVMRGKEDVTANYTFGESVDGELAITPRSVTLTSADDSKTYDGTPLTNSNVTVSGEGFVEGEGATYNVTGTITDPGDAANAFTYTLNSGTLADNYSIETVPGTLTVTRVTKEIVITAASDSKIYDGSPLTNADYTYTEGILAEGDELTAVVEGTITDVGTAANVVTSYKVMRGEADVTANYTFGKSVDGELAITPRSVTLTSASDSKVYDGSPLTNDTVTVSGDGFAEGEGATYKVIGTITDPGNVKNAFIYTLNSNTKADNYEIETVEGTLIVKSVEDEIIITAASDSKMYDGTPLTNADYTYTEGILAKGDVLTAVVEGTITDAGKADNVVTSYKVMRGETDVTANYTFGDSVKGTLEITKRSVTLTSATDSKVYDGTPLTNDKVAEGGDGFAEGEGASYNVTGSQTLVDSSKNTFTYTLNEGTKAGNYEIKKVEGTLTVTDGSNPPDTPVDPELVVTKTAPEGKFALGAEVTFDIKATNIYDEAQTITLSEIEGVTLAQSTFENVAPGATIETTAKYTITEADIKAGSFTNTVTAKLGNITKTAEATVDTEAAKTSMKVEKVTTSTPAKDGKYALGEKITYKITALNDGNQTIENFFIVDKLTGDKKFVESLAPGKTEEFAVEYIVTEADIVKGYVRNEATLYPTDPKDPDTPLIPDTPDDPPAIPHDPPVIDVPVEDPISKLSIDKEVTSTPALEAGYALNETVKYKITVKNTGNLTMTGVEVKDDLTGETWTIDSLTPGEERVYKPTYIITAEDVKAGSVVNVATVSGKPPVEGLDPPPTDDDTVTVPTTEETPDKTITVVYYTNYPVDGMDNEYRIYLNVPVPFTWPGFNAVFGADKVPKGFDFVRWNLHTPGQSASSSSSMASEGSVRGLAMMSGSSDATIPDEEKDADFVFYAQWQMRINPNPGGTGYKPEIEDPEPGDDPDPGDEPEPTPPPTPGEEPEEDEEINEPDDPFAGYEEEPDDEIDDNPMPFTPYTGDDRHTAAWGFVSLLSLAGIAVLGRKRREEEE